MMKNDPPRHRYHRLALLLPFVWQLGAVGLVNAVAWRPFGLPFPMVWQMAGIVIASATIAFVFWRDETYGDSGDPAE